MIDTKEIYDFVIKNLSEMKNAAQSVDLQLFGDDKQGEKRKELLENANKILGEIEPQIKAELEALKKVGEFDTYTIAFYGETNAGKSTLIEALRLYFDEPSKRDEQGRFDKFNAEFSVQNSRIAKDLALIREQITQIQSEISQKEATIQEKQGFFVNFLAFFNPNSPKRALKRLKNSLKTAQNEQERLVKALENLLGSKLAQGLVANSDGVIVGDGRQDFTQKTTTYHFSTQGTNKALGAEDTQGASDKTNGAKPTNKGSASEKNFDILDVPGIEGREGAVVAEILNATKKAHCVFYIMSGSNVQKGDGQKGTLEKIKEHLGAQTEVYAIFNKPTTSPNALDTIISKDDESGLKELDKNMAKTLGEHYAGRKTLSAQAAFLALGERLPDFENDEFLPKNLQKSIKARKKFLAKFSENELLEKSLFLDFVRFLQDELVQNVDEKIKNSVCNKALVVLAKMDSAITQVQGNFDKLYKDCKKEVDSACKQIDRIGDNIENKFTNALDLATTKWVKRVREEMYDYIDLNVKDKEFESKFERVLERERDEETLAKDFENACKGVQNELQKDIENALKNLQRRLGNIAKNFQSIAINDEFGSLNINIDSGIDIMGLLGGGIGLGVGAFIIATTNFWNPLGLLALAGGLLSLAKSVWKFFSDDYKKSEQRKAVNENLSKIVSNIKNEANSAVKKQVADEVKPRFDELKEGLKNSVENVSKVAEFYANLRQKEVQPLMKNIKFEGGLK